MNHRTTCFRIAILLLAMFLSYVFVSGVAEKSFVLYAREDMPGPPDPTPEERLFEKQAVALFEKAEKLPRSRYKDIFGEYTGAVADKMDMERLFFASYGELENLLDSAAEKSIDALMLFSLPMMQRRDSRALVLDKETLLRLNKRYNLHALFLISAPCADDDSMVRMKFLVTGQGKFIVGYERNVTIQHPEYTMATGRYGYRELFVMDAKTDERGNAGLFNIKGLSTPDGEYEWMRGPLNVKIRSLSFTSESGNEKKILVTYDLLVTRKEVVDRLPIERVPQKKDQALKK